MNPWKDKIFLKHLSKLIRKIMILAEKKISLTKSLSQIKWNAEEAIKTI